MTHERTVRRGSGGLHDRLDHSPAPTPGRRAAAAEPTVAMSDAVSPRDATAPASPPASDARPAGRVGTRSMLDRIFGVGDGIGLHGGSGLTDKGEATPGQGPASETTATPGAHDAKRAEGEELGE